MKLFTAIFELDGIASNANPPRIIDNYECTRVRINDIDEINLFLNCGILLEFSSLKAEQRQVTIKLSVERYEVLAYSDNYHFTIGNHSMSAVT